jgi:TrmH family RNA methyltransferase
MTVPHQADTRLRPVASRQNSLVKDLRKAFSQGEPTSEGAVAIEGVRIIEEAVRSGLRFQAIFFSESAQKHAARLMPQISSHTEALLLPDDVFSSAVSTETPQGVAALVKMKPGKLEDLLGQVSNSFLAIAAAGIQDPGNLGTIIRTAEAFSARGVLLGEKTVSPFNPKVVRASAGSLFREPLIAVKLADAITQLKQAGVRLMATSSHKGLPVDEADFTGPVLIAVGNEGAGLPPEVLALADDLITILHSPKVESLNAGIAASIILYEAARQKRKDLTADER